MRTLPSQVALLWAFYFGVSMNWIKEQKPWTKEEDDILFRSIGKMTYLSMSKKIKRSIYAIGGRARQLHLSNDIMESQKKYSVNEDFFADKNILSCYYAGLLAADGNVSLNGSRLHFGQIAPRKKFVENMVKDLEYTGVIYKTKKKKKKHKDAYRITISSKKIISDLDRNFNITPKKSLTLKPPSLKGDFAIAFVMGYIDGDGCIGVFNKGQKPLVMVCGTKKVVEWIKNVLYSCTEPIYNRERKLYQAYKKGKKKKNTYTFEISGARAVCLFFHAKRLNLPGFHIKWDKIEKLLKRTGNDYFFRDKHEWGKDIPKPAFKDFAV